MFGEDYELWFPSLLSLLRFVATWSRFDVHILLFSLLLIYEWHIALMGTAVAHWLRCCATNRKFAGSIPAGVSGIFIDTKSFRSHCGPGVDSASNRNEYQEYFRGVKAVGA